MDIIKKRIFFVLASALVLVIIFFVPLYFSWFQQTANVFTLPKIVLFRILMVFLAWVVVADFFYSLPAPAEKFSRIFSLQKLAKKILKTKGQKTILGVFSALVFFLSLIISTCLSVDRQTSLLGSYARGQGLVAYLFYFLFFIILLYIFRQKKFIFLALKAAVVSAFFVCLYGWAQVAGLDPLPWSENFFTSGRLAASLGQPNFLAAWLLLVMPLSAYFWSAAKKFSGRLFWLIVLLVQLSCLFLTYSRAGWLGLVVGLLVVAYFWLWQKRRVWPRRRLAKIIWLGVLAVVVLAIGFWLGIKNLDNQTFLKRRLISFVNWQKGSWPARLVLWRASWPAISQRPFWGYGLDNQGEALLPYYDRKLSVQTGPNIYPDRAHNILLDWTLTAGLAGVLSFLALLWLAFRHLVRNIYQGQNQRLAMAFLAGLTGYLFALLFGFSSVVDSIYFWFYLAVIFSWPAGANLRPAQNQRRLKIKKLYVVFSRLIIIFLFLAAVLFAANQAQAVAADYYWRQMQIADSKNDVLAAFSAYQHLKNFKPRPYYYEQAGQVFANWSLASNSFLFSGFLSDINTRLKPHSYLSHLAKAQVLAALADNKHQQFFSLAEQEFNFLLAHSPHFPYFYYWFGRLLVKEKKYRQAGQSYQTALRLLPAENDWRLSREHRQQIKQMKYLLYKELARLAAAEKDFSLALKYYRLAFLNNPAKIALLSKMAQAAFANNDIQSAIWYTKIGWRRQPGNYFWPQNLALIYEKIDHKDKAEKYRQTAKRLKKIK